tara:strand:+ start:178 stop:588 length:411 start_codon:yes stop_codon:yes gene_type:complete
MKKDNYIQKNLGKKKDPKLSAKQVMELTALIGKWLAYSEHNHWSKVSIKDFLEQIVMMDLSRFTDQYFYTLKKYSFKKEPTKMKIKGMEWFRLISSVEKQIKKDECIGQEIKKAHSFYNGKTIDGKAEKPKKELGI